MARRRNFLIAGVAVMLTATLGLSPAVSSYADAPKSSNVLNFGRAAEVGFTPAGADPRLAAVIDRYNVKPSRFAFTPAFAPVSSRVEGEPITVTVAVRSTPSFVYNSLKPVVQQTIVAPKPQSGSGGSLEMMPGGYKLGRAVGWRNFSTPGSVKPFGLEGSKIAATDPALSGALAKPKRLSTRMQLESATLGNQATRAQYKDKSIGVDLESSYRLTRKLNLTAGIKYKAERDRFDRAPDTVRDNQAVYIGTRFKF